jgi:hypothetical protein
MTTIELNKDITVFYVTAPSFPQGIQEATSKLHSLFPFTPGRKIFGLSRPENGGEIVYRAAAEELEQGEGKTYHCETLAIKRGIYISQKLDNFRQDPMAIDRAFKTLLKHPDLDPDGYCVEWYETKGPGVTCMIRLK